MEVVVGPLAGTGCSGVFGRIGIGIGDPWLLLPGPPLTTNPSRVAPPVVVVVPSLGGT